MLIFYIYISPLRHDFLLNLLEWKFFILYMVSCAASGSRLSVSFGFQCCLSIAVPLSSHEVPYSYNVYTDPQLSPAGFIVTPLHIPGVLNVLNPHQLLHHEPSDVNLKALSAPIVFTFTPIHLN